MIAEMEATESEVKSKPLGPLSASVDRDNFVRELGIAIGAVSKKTFTPILGNVLLEGHGDLLTITGTNIGLTIRCRIEAVIQKPGSCTLPAQKLLEYARLSATGGELQITFDEKSWAVLKRGGSRIRMAGTKSEDFPLVPQPDTEHVCDIPAGVLSRLIKQTYFAIIDQEGKFSPRGALLNIGGQVAVMATADGARLQLSETVIESEAAAALLIPVAALREMARMADSVAAVSLISFSHSDSQILATVDRRTITCQKMSGSFPDYARIVGLVREGKTFSASKDAITGALERARCFSGDESRSVKLDISETGVRVVSVSQMLGDSNETLEVESTGSAAIGFQVDFLLEAIKATMESSVTFLFVDDKSAVKITGKGGTDYMSIVMPKRLEF